MKTFTLYSTSACHLCELAKAMIEAQMGRAGGMACEEEDISESDALFEARRCLSCGNCFECDGCFGACPEEAIIKLGPGKRYKFDFDRCTGCATCFEQCPCHAIEMIDEPEQAQVT